MRTIKYRAWHPVQRRMFSVYSVIMPKNKNSKNGCKIYVTENIGGRCISWRNVEIMQFIGLKDKNGVDIFEGDVVRGVSTHKGQSHVFCGYGVWQPFSYLGTYNGSEFEVIGNIFSNPELLNGEGNE